MRIDRAHHAPSVPTEGATVLSHAARQLRQFMCGLHGHDTLMHFEGRHVSLVCTSCGYKSPGWSLPGAPTGPAAPPRAPRTPLAREQRLA